MRVRGRVERFRDELVLEVDRHRPRRPTATASTRPRSCRSPTATSTSSTASSSTSRARSTTPATGACSTRCWPTRSCARRGAGRRARGRATTPTSAGCSSTRSRSATLAQELCQLHPRLNSDLLLTAALVHDLGRTREFTYGAEIGLTEEGRLLGHLVIGAADARSSAPAALDEERRLALLHCVLCHHGAGRRARRALRVGRGAGAVPAQRARRGRQGRARARARAAGGPKRLAGRPARATPRSISAGAARAWWPIRSSKLAGPGSPRLGRFDSFAASCRGRCRRASHRPGRRLPLPWASGPLTQLSSAKPRGPVPPRFWEDAVALEMPVPVAALTVAVAGGADSPTGARSCRSSSCCARVRWMVMASLLSVRLGADALARNQARGAQIHLGPSESRGSGGAVPRPT